jgi:hypothetical protein
MHKTTANLINGNSKSVEVAAAVCGKAHDLAVQNAIVRADTVGDLLRKKPELGEGAPSAGHQPTAVAFDVCEGAEAVVLQFKQPIGISAISSRYGSQALALGARFGRATASKSVDSGAHPPAHQLESRKPRRQQCTQDQSRRMLGRQ